MRTKSIVLLALALGCGLVASIGISQIIEQNKKGGGPAVETEAILVAMKPIASQEQLKAENIKLEQWPRNLIPKGALTRVEDVDGRRIKHAIAPGEPILQNKLVGEQDKRPTIDVPPAFPGQHTREILEDWGVTKDRIDELVDSGAVVDT